MAGGTKPEIWTKSQYKEATGGKWPRKKLVTIDYLLEHWPADKAKGVGDRTQTLMNLARNCEAYIARQEQKVINKQAKRSKPSALLVKRIAQTKLLVEQIFRRLAYEMHEYRKTNMGIGQVGNVHRQVGAQSLQQGYQHERTGFLQTKLNQGLSGVGTNQGGGINPQGGTWVHKVHSEILNSQGGRQNFEGLQGKVIPQNILALGQVNFDQLSSQQFQQLHQFFAPNPNEMQTITQGAEALVHYYRKDERLAECMLTPLDGKLRNANGTLHSCRNAGGLVAEAWAMDEYGNILAKDFIRQQLNVGGIEVMFNHSSLAAGNDVLCAGMIEIWQGEVKGVSNESGHYRPTAQMMANSLLVMRDELGLDVENTVTSVMDMGSGITYNSVANFWAVHPHI